MANSIDGRLVSSRTRRSLAGLRVEAAVVASPLVPARTQVLGSATANADGAFSIPIDPSVFKRLVESAADVEFRVLDPNGQPLPISGRVLWNGRRADQPIVLVVNDGSTDPDPTDLFSVQGVLTNESGVAVIGMRAEVWDHNVAGASLIGSSISGSDGHYVVTFEPSALGQKTAGDIEVRVFDPRQDRGAIAHSDVVFQAEQHLTVDLTLPGADVSRLSEFERLTGALQPLLGTTSLADASAETIGYLAGRSAWDARAIAMAAQASKLSDGTRIPASHYYALLRSGLPGDDTAIHRLDDAQVEATLELAVKNGVISGSDSINDTVRLHHDEATKVLTTFTPPHAVSSLGTMMALRLNADQQNTFVDAYRSTSQDPPAALWKALEQRGFDAATIANLQTDAVLGDLTLQNAAVVGRLTRDAEIERPADLATKGFYTADKWAGLVGNDVPAGVTAADYVAGLAAQVAITYPTLVAADIVRSKQVIVGDDAVTNEVAAFLGDPGDFAVGKHPVHTWTGFEQLSAEGRSGAQLVERLYQLSPSNGSMIALSKLGLGSAMQMMKYSPNGFVTKFGQEFPTQTEAMMVYKKAQEVHTTALNIATMYLSYRAAPNVFAITGNLQRVDPQPNPEIAASATLEELFGNMDYCACEHCKSVLSPAAYLVELLEFIDLSDVPHTKSDPLTVLLGRRPDLQHILLTCENTNIALPYIDLVNEVLEYFIVHGSLATFTGYNMRVDSQTADLLADPEFVVDAAYDATKSKVYPFGLPFDMPLEHLRLLFEVFDSSLPDALAVFGDPAGARRERLRLNAPEYSILTDIGFRQLPEYFGEPSAASIDALNNVVGVAKTFCRRVGLLYTELADVLESTFVNPGLSVVPLLEALGVSLAQIQARFDGTLSDQAFTALLPPGLDQTPYGGNVLQWLDANRDAIMGLIVLTDQSDEPGECDFAKVDLRFSLPDMNANRLTLIAYHRLHRFIRVWKKLGWTIDQTDSAFSAFLGVSSATLTTGNIDAAFVPFLARLANFLTLMQRASVSKKKVVDWLTLWSDPQDATSQQTRLAKLLRIGITDLQHFIEITGVDPFADDMATDEPSMLTFVDRWLGLKSSRLKVTDLDYLLRHDDLTGKLTPRPEDLARDIRTLRDSLTAVDADLNVPPATADLGAVRAKMALVYDPSIVDCFFGLVANTTVYSVPLVTAEEALPSKLAVIDAQLAIDPFQKTLTHLGLLSAAVQTALDTAADALTLADMEQIQVQGDLDAFVAAFKTAVQALRDAGDADLDGLGAEYPELKTVHDALAGTTDPATQATTILGAILPELRAGLKDASLRNCLVAGTKADPLVIDALTSDPAVLHANSDNTKTILADFLALETVQTFDANQTYTVLVDPPATDSYVIYVTAPQNTSVTLVVDGTPAIPATVLTANGEAHSGAPIKFTAGTLARLELTLAGLPGGTSAVISWRTKGIARSPIPTTRQYTTTSFDQARSSLIRLEKAVMLQRALGLTAGEVDHFGAHHADTNGVWNDLDTDGTIADGPLHAIAGKVALLVWFAQLKKDHEPDPDTFLHILEQPDALNAQGRLVVASVMEWSEADLDAVLAAFGMTKADLAGLRAFRKVSEAMDLVATTLQPASDLIAWSVADPDGALLTAIRTALRARMTDAAWLETMQSVSDELRNKRRDALVAFILFHQPPSPEIETADQLYEYFLIDVQMDACMQTSRIRQALSTAQLFIQRCLMNLELDVSADSIREDQWQWMKRYRVWEANRKVFLYPENWLEPELRDDKSSFFRDLESELLKADITDDAAEVAYLDYLKKLDEVARVEVVCSYLEENEAGNQDDDVLHVFGRTLGATREYYYRRFEYGYWTPWEKIPLHIEGEVLIPTVWKSQLFVFWLTHVESSEPDRTQTPQAVADSPWGNSATVTAELTVHWGEYFNGQWTSPKSTEMKQPIRFTGLDHFDQTKVAAAARTFKPNANVSERLVLTLLYLATPFNCSKVTFTSKNSAPHVADSSVDDDLFNDVDLFNYHLLWELHPNAVFDANSLINPGATLDVNIGQPANASADWRTEVVFTKTNQLLNGFQVRPVMSPVENQWEAPLFYWDDHSVFFVSGDETIGSEFTRYYVDDFVPSYVDKIKDIPKLYEEPVKLVKPQPGDPVIDPFITAVNPNYKVVITDNGTFKFGGQTFDARGAVPAARFE